MFLKFIASLTVAFALLAAVSAPVLAAPDP
jgi:hypothetical protein